jgi:hypothetical protein
MNFIALAVIAALVIAWMWGRSAVLRRGGWRVGAGLFAVVLVVIGAVLLIKGSEIPGLISLAVGLLSAAGGRINRGAYGFGAQSGPSPRAPSPQAESMSDAQARSLLGVEPGATPVEIRDAYKRLMQRAHPDKGGTAGLAAQLNAARDRLLKP